MTEKEEAIYELQEYLRNISLAFGEVPLFIPDGKFSGEIGDAVRLIQKNAGFEETGIVDFLTWEEIKRQNSRAIFEKSKPIQIIAIENDDLPLRQGEESIFVHSLKLMLSKVGKKFPSFYSEDTSSLFDESTRRNVLLWQEAVFLPQTGEVDKATWNTLAEYFLSVK